MNASSIIFIVVILLLLYIVIHYLTKDVSMLQKNVMDATVMTTIQPITSKNTSISANSGNFTYSIWFYVNDWN